MGYMWDIFSIRLFVALVLWSTLMFGMYRRTWFKDNPAGSALWWSHHAGFIFLILHSNPWVQGVGFFIFYDDWNQHFFLARGKGLAEYLLKGRLVSVVEGFIFLIAALSVRVFFGGNQFLQDIALPLFLTISSLIFYDLLLSSYMKKNGESFLHLLAGSLQLYEIKYRIGFWLSTSWLSRFAIMRRIADTLMGP